MMDADRRARLAAAKAMVNELKKPETDERRAKMRAYRKDMAKRVGKRPEGQRQVRERDPGYLAFLRRQPCAVRHLGGCEGKVQAAHIRMSSAKHGVRNPGLQCKPSDQYAAPPLRASSPRRSAPRLGAGFLGARRPGSVRRRRQPAREISRRRSAMTDSLSPSALSAEELDALEKAIRADLARTSSKTLDFIGLATEHANRVLRLLAAARNQARTPVSDGGAETIEAVAKALCEADADFGYSMNLTRLVEDEATYTLQIKGEAAVDYPGTDECYEHIAKSKSRKRAAAVLSALAARTPVEDGGATLSDVAQWIWEAFWRLDAGKHLDKQRIKRLGDAYNRLAALATSREGER